MRSDVTGNENQFRTLRSDGGHDLAGRLLRIGSPEDRVYYCNTGRPMHHDLHRTVCGDAPNCNCRMVDECLEPLESIYSNRGSSITLGFRAEYRADTHVIRVFRVGHFRLAA